MDKVMVFGTIDGGSIPSKGTARQSGIPPESSWVDLLDTL